MNPQPCATCPNITTETSGEYVRCAFGHYVRPATIRPTCENRNRAPSRADLIHPWHDEDRPPRAAMPYPKKKPKAKACECGCGEMASPGKRWLRGHSNRGRKIPREGR